MTDVKQRVLPSAPQSPYVVLPTAAVQQLSTDDYATPPPSPVSDKKSCDKPLVCPATAACEYVPSGSAASDDKRVTPVSTAKGLCKPGSTPTLPLALLECFAECVRTSPLSNDSKCRFFVSLIESAERSVHQRLEAGQLALLSTASGHSDGRRSVSAASGSAAASFTSRHRDKHGGKYHILNGDINTYNANDVPCTLGATTGTWGMCTDALLIVTSMTTGILNYPSWGDQWGQLDPGSTAFRWKRAKVELTYYPRNRSLTTTPADGASSTWDPLSISTMNVRTIVLRDKWGALANGTTASPSALCSTSVNVSSPFSTGHATPGDFTSVFMSSTDPTLPASPSGPSTLNSVNRLHFNPLTQAYRYEVLYDQIHDVAKMEVYAPQSGGPRQAWVGQKRVSIDLKLDTVSLCNNSATPVFGEGAPPLTNALYVLHISNMNVATLGATLTGQTAQTQLWMPVVAVDIDIYHEFEPILPVSSAP